MKRRGFLTALIAIPFAPLLAKLEAKKAAELAKKRRIISLLQAKTKMLEEQMRKQVNQYYFSDSLKVRSYTEFDPIDLYDSQGFYQGFNDSGDLRGISPAEYEWKQVTGEIHIAI